MEQAAGLRRREHRDRVRRTRRAQVRPLERIDGDIDLREVPAWTGWTMLPSSRDPRHDDQDRTVALAAQLSAVHDDLRAGCASSVTVSAGMVRRRPESHRRSPGSSRTASASRRALQAHHTGEDDGLFAALRAERPDLGPML